MFPSKADRILSRYRPIAPKPLPIPPSGSFATDPSSTCASLDSLASSGKARRSRKRRIAPATLSAGKCPKAPKSEKPYSNNNAGFSASSLTQGNSDGTVPHGDLSYASHSYGAQEHVAAPLSTSQHMVMDVSESAHTPLRDPAVAMAPFHHHVAGSSLVEQARMFMVANALKAKQQPILPHSPQPRGYAGGGVTEKDLAFMERAAASTVLPADRGATGGLSCSAGCMKGVGYGGGGFTEMIRGITRLPTAADVQSLMQARSGAPATASTASPGMLSPLEDSACGRSSPGVKEAHQRRLELHSPAPAAPLSHLSWAPNLPSQLLQVDDCTLPLLPNLPSKLSLSPSTLQAEPSMRHSSYRAEPPLDHTDLFHSDQTTTLLSFSSCSENIPATCSVRSRDLSGQLGTLRQMNNDADDTEAHPLLSRPHMAKFLGGLASGVPSAQVHDGAPVDQVYLQQVYGGSTEPVLLVDDNSQVLWFNKAYDRALKSVQERLSSKPTTTGPYFDPLGHPTPLGSLVLNLPSCAVKPVNATLWGFLKKLVNPEVDASSSMLRGRKVEVGSKEEQSEDSSSLCLSVGARLLLSSTHVCSSSAPACRIDSANDMQGCVSVGKLTTVTLESITEVHMGEGAATVECVEMVEARLGVAGSMPAFITDCTSRVRWVNAAFKQMLGDSEQQGNSMVMMMHGTGSNNVGVVKHEPPELTFVCSAEKIPRSAWAFSGRVNLEWMKAGKRRSMTVPCDVSRLVTTATWVWKFDIALSLSLNLRV
eukprot:c20460_g1_i1 orf=122-2413(+)